ncbi:MAG: HEPN domain-containing protein [Planctomycetes bacterium]|nr:HEPN domain-containing protein [Planctomycetota bacterium]
MDRSADWMEQAKRDLEVARWQRQGRYYEWAAFAAQQAAEKAIKAACQHHGGDAWGHSCRELLQALLDDLGRDEPGLLDAARLLDRFYIPARYPNGWSAGTPKDYFSEGDADDAIRAAEEILRFCDDLLAGP